MGCHISRPLRRLCKITWVFKSLGDLWSRGTGRSRGFGFIPFSSTEAVESAIQAVNGMASIFWNALLGLPCYPFIVNNSIGHGTWNVFFAFRSISYIFRAGGVKHSSEIRYKTCHFRCRSYLTMLLVYRVCFLRKYNQHFSRNLSWFSLLIWLKSNWGWLQVEFFYSRTR